MTVSILGFGIYRLHVAVADGDFEGGRWIPIEYNNTSVERSYMILLSRNWSDMIFKLQIGSEREVNSGGLCLHSKSYKE